MRKERMVIIHNKNEMLIEIPVLVVGAGPVGSTAALLLARSNIQSLIIDSKEGPIFRPAGHVINARTMEIWRSIDPILERTIRNSSPDAEQIRYITWCTRLAGYDLGRCEAVPNDPEEIQKILSWSSSRTVHFPQHLLEPLLWEYCKNSELIRMLKGCKWTGLIQTQTGVIAKAYLLNEGKEVTIRAKYLIAADGASSPIRKKLSIAMNGPILQNLMSVYFKADLSKYMRTREGVIYWIINKDVIGLFVHQTDNDWVFMFPYFPPQERPENFSEAEINKLLIKAINSEEIDFEIKSIGSWAMTAQLADTYRKDKVFLVGDSAHRFPPTGGYGTNTGVQDAHNLVWKLSAVLNGKAPESILDTYETERKPVALENCNVSVYNYEHLDMVNSVIGLSNKRMAFLRKIQNSTLFHILPFKWQKFLIRFMVNQGLKRANVLEMNNFIGRKYRKKIRTAILAQWRHFHAPGLELGFSYENGLIIPESGFKPISEDPIGDYKPTTWPGSRLPHFWLYTRSGNRLSIHDLLDYSSFLLISEKDTGEYWNEALEELRETISYQIHFIPISDSSDSDYYDPENNWNTLSEVERGGAVLVRPDGHVFWRGFSKPTSREEAISYLAIPMETIRKISKAKSPKQSVPNF